jgi:phage shock protein A
MTPDGIESVRNVAFLRELMPYLEAELAKMDKALENKTFSAMNKGELTPQLALEAWIEKNSYAKLLGKLSQQVRIGQSIGEKHRTTLET